MPDFKDGVFDIFMNHAKLYVPAAIIDDYKSSSKFSNFDEILPLSAYIEQSTTNTSSTRNTAHTTQSSSASASIVGIYTCTTSKAGQDKPKAIFYSNGKVTLSGFTPVHILTGGSRDYADGAIKNIEGTYKKVGNSYAITWDTNSLDVYFYDGYGLWLNYNTISAQYKASFLQKTNDVKRMINQIRTIWYIEDNVLRPSYVRRDSYNSDCWVK